MKIRQRNNGDWCMEHNGVEAPYEVFCHQEDKFTVFDLEDDDTPVANLQDAITAERLTRAHYLRAGALNSATATSLLNDRPNPRIQRANALASCIVHQCHDLIPRAIFSEFQDRVTGILSQHGVEVITDADRADAGLPPRDGHGMTFEELAAYERVRLKLISPMQTIKITPLQEDQANET